MDDSEEKVSKHCERHGNYFKDYPRCPHCTLSEIGGVNPTDVYGVIAYEMPVRPGWNKLEVVKKPEWVGKPFEPPCGWKKVKEVS